MKFQGIKINHILSTKCNLPCAIINTYFGIPDKEEFKNGRFHLKLYFKNNIAVKTSHVAYPLESLLAEVGGYLGLLLGVSLMDITNLLGKLWNLIKHHNFVKSF